MKGLLGLKVPVSLFRILRFYLGLLGLKVPVYPLFVVFDRLDKECLSNSVKIFGRQFCKYNTVLGGGTLQITKILDPRNFHLPNTFLATRQRDVE